VDHVPGLVSDATSHIEGLRLEESSVERIVDFVDCSGLFFGYGVEFEKMLDQ
jgi:hypothetical protein